MKFIASFFALALCLGRLAFAQGIPLQGLLPAHVFEPPAQTVIGDLGGAPVTIPFEWIELAVYEDHPYWLQPRKGYVDPIPQRTFESKLVSLGLMIHLPTMQPLTASNQEAHKKRGFRDVEWVGAVVIAGNLLNFKKEEYFLTAYDSEVPGKELQRYEYEALPDVHGLKAWRATKDIVLNMVLDDNDRKQSAQNHHLYFAYEGERITAFIKCDSGLTPASGKRHTCHHSFVMWPDMRAEVSVAYPPEQLANWREYQDKFRRLLLSFRVSPKQ